LECRGNRQILVEILNSIRVQDADLGEVLSHARDIRADEFSHSLGIPWKREDLRARHIDETNWRYTVDQARLNITKVLEDLSPSNVDTPEAWVFRYLSTVKHGFHLGAGENVVVPAVKLVPQQTESAPLVDDGQVTIPTDPKMVDQLADLTGNAAVGLFLLIRLLYISAFGRDPRSPAFVMIWQELHQARGQGA